jgi:hypothetical protein
LTDCAVARLWHASYVPPPPFADFLTHRFRMDDPVTPGGPFTGPRYAIAVADGPEGPFRAFDFRITRAGDIRSSRSVSISEASWRAHRTIACSSNP